MDDPNEDSTSMAAAMRWVSRITAVGLEMVLPGVAGWWLDQKLGSNFVATVVGFGLGMTFGIWHLLRMTGESSDSPPKK